MNTSRARTYLAAYFGQTMAEDVGTGLPDILADIVADLYEFAEGRGIVLQPYVNEKMRERMPADSVWQGRR